MAADDLIGTLVGEYRVLRPIGKGGMGLVYEGAHPLIGRRVAIKVLKRALAGEGSNARRFMEEARTVNAVQHPGIVDVFGFGSLPDGRLYLVMELLEGESFSAYLERCAPLPADEAVRWLDQILEALEAAHTAGIVHRDLKPSNLFLTGPKTARRLKVLDFGISKRLLHTDEQLTRLTQTNTVLGTPNFMAPEQIRGEPVFASDLYSLGCIAWSMLTGKMLVPGGMFDALNAHLNTPAPPPSSVVPSVPHALDAVVLRLLEKHPGLRPASAGAAREQFAALGTFGAAGVPTAPARTREDLPSLVQTATIDVPGQTHDLPAAGPVTQTASLNVPALPGRRRAWRWLAGLVAVLGGGALVVLATSAPQPDPLAPPAVAAMIAEPAPAPRLEPPLPAVARADPAPKPDPAPPPVAIARPPPARVDHKAARAARPPAVPVGPSSAALSDRLAVFERAHKEGRASGGRAAGLLLEDARERLAGARSDADRGDLERFLDDWERRFLPRLP
ncbi:MAG: serine/threonine-protein kinase [Myxococcaceae bacterium]